MNGIKTFDFFQKVSLNAEVRPTLIGSIISLSAICLMISLFIREIYVFFSPHISYDAFVAQDENQNERIKLNLNIRMNHVPCNLISLDQEDTMRNHLLDISDTVEKQVLLKTGNTEKYNAQEGKTLDSLYKAIQNDNGCLLRGHVNINKVPGNLHVSFHNYRPQWNMLRAQKKELANKVSFSHHISRLYFGDVSPFTFFRYGLDPRSFTRGSDMPSFLVENQQRNYVYYLKLIPYLFVNENNGRKEKAYQYSLSYKENEFDSNSDEMPIILIKYDFSPVTMKVTIKSRDYLHFLTHVCAIIGGVFVVFSILNRLLLGIFDRDKN